MTAIASSCARCVCNSRFAWVWGMTVVLGIVALWQRRRLDRELRTLMTLQQQILGTRFQADGAGGYAA